MATYKPLQTVTLTSDTTSLTFSGIDQNYTDLILIASAKAVAAGDDLGIRFNGDSSSIYSYVFLTGDGSSATRRVGGSQSGIICDYNGSVRTSEYTIHTINIPSYSSTINNKSVLIRANSSTGVDASVNLWRSTAAITSMTFYLTTGNTFSAGSTFSLYGIKSGAPQALGGDIVVTDGTYWYHAFKSTASFTPLKTLTADYLVVAGGGGGGLSSPYGGGGGAGGFRTSTSNTLNATSYTVTVGAGGSAGVPGTAGNASSINSFAASGGGLGGNDNTNGGSGGSGGGGRSSQNGSNTVNTNYGAGNSGGYSPVEGYRGAGGWQNFAVAGAGGGGGGAGAIGGDPSAGAGGAGGIGSFNAISGGATTGVGILSGGNYYFAGGGGGAGLNSGGTGGTGGGGNGSVGTGGSPAGGNTNTGGGGGGTYGSNTSGSGGSGIVVVRYAV